MSRRSPRSNTSVLFAAGFLAAVACCGAATVLALYSPAEPASGPLFAVLIAGFILSLMLAGLAGARLVRVLWRRTEGGPAPRLHLRFVVLFGLAAITPAVLMAAFFGVLLTRGLETWFGERVEASVESTAETAELFLEHIVEQVELDAATAAADLSQPEVRAVFEEDPETYLREALGFQAQFRQFRAAYIVLPNGQDILGYESDVAPEFRPPSAEWIAIVRDQAQAQVEVDREAEVLRVLAPLQDYPIEVYFYAVPDINPALFDQFRTTAAAIGAFRDARDQRRRIEAFFIIVYLEAALLILAGSIWLALSAAGRVAGPVGRLVEAADRVREGELTARVEIDDEHDEISALARAFNLMTGQIERQQHELIDANAESEGQRRLIEAVLLGVSAGVLSVDEAGVVRLANRSASELLGADQTALRDRALLEIAPALSDIAARARTRPGGTVEEQVELKRDGAVLTLNVRAAMETEAGRVVLTFDDITRLIAAQRNAAWRDVARRIAHEIKNPLTPIQLSAERLRRRYRPQDDSAAEIFDRCTDTIVRQVSDIGRMVDEFSSFARMPTPHIERVALLDIVQETVFARRVASPGIRVMLEAPDAEVMVRCDARLASQALTNILKNAAESIAARLETGDGRPARIDVRVRVNGLYGVIDVQDNGAGWPDDGRERLTEPYMTTREKGTGLGLAIVQRIMEDHGGRLELDAREDGAQGALVRLSFPLSGRGAEAEAAE